MNNEATWTDVREACTALLLVSIDHEAAKLHALISDQQALIADALVNWIAGTLEVGVDDVLDAGPAGTLSTLAAAIRQITEATAQTIADTEARHAQ